MMFRALVAGHVRENGLRALISIAAVALGVGIVLAIDLANATAIASLRQSVQLVGAQPALQIVGVGRGFDERVLRRIRRLRGVEQASPIVTGDIVATPRSGRRDAGEVLHLVGIDMLAPTPSLSETAPVAPDLLVHGRGAFISRRVATRYGLRRGSILPAVANGRTLNLHVADILERGQAVVDSSVVFVDIVTAQEVLGKVGLLDRIDCDVAPERVTPIERQLAGLAPAAARVTQPKERDAELRRLLRSFQLNLSILSYLALMVAATLVYNAIAISVVQRRDEIGTLRALGTARFAVFWTFVLEGALFGTMGSIAGLALGAYLAQFSVQAVAHTVSTLYATANVDAVAYDPALMVRAFFVGVTLSLLAATVPAVVAAALPPASTMRSRGSEWRVPAGGAWWLVAGVGAFALAALAARAPALDGLPVFGYAACVACIVGGAAFVLPGLLASERIAARFGRLFPLPARLAIGGLAATPRRASVAIASLMLAVATVVGVGTLTASLRGTVLAWSNDTLRADLFISPAGTGGQVADATLPAELVRRFERVPGVEAVDTLRTIDVPFRGTLTTLVAVDARKLALRGHVRIVDGTDAATLARTMPGANILLASQALRERFGVRRGDAIALTTARGTQILRVASIFSDYSSDAGLLLIDRESFARLYHDTSVNAIAVYARPGADVITLRSRLVGVAGPIAFDASTTAELRRLVAAIFDRTFAITYALFAISVTIAVLGVVGALFALVLERRQEIGILRYLGLSRRGVQAMVFCEASVLGVLGALYGVGVGLLLAVLLVFVIDRQAFGWVATFHVPTDVLVQTVVAIVAAALAGGIYPASVAARVRTDEAMRAE